MNTRILVAYATMFGSTGEVAHEIGNMLRDEHTVVDVCTVLDVSNLSQYHAVVVGSAIYNGEWLPEAVRFVRLHNAALSTMPVACFATCMMLHRATPKNRRTLQTYINTIRHSAPCLASADVQLFAGKLRYRNLQWLERIEFLVLSWLPPGDFRDWNAVRSWAKHVRPTLVPGVPA